MLVRKTKSIVVRKLGEIFSGGQSWSPKYKKDVKTIKSWIKIVKLKKNVNTSRKNIEYKPNNISLQQAN